jgi:hypothetical protein
VFSCWLLFSEYKITQSTRLILITAFHLCACMLRAFYLLSSVRFLCRRIHLSFACMMRSKSAQTNGRRRTFLQKQRKLLLKVRDFFSRRTITHRVSLSLGANILFYEETAGCGARLSCNYHNKTTAGNRGIEMRKVIKQRPSPDLN